MENEKTFRPTESWMRDKYNEMNAELFNGELGDCDFTVFTTGRGSGGRSLGWFKLDGTCLKVNRRDRSIYMSCYYGSPALYVNARNFASICKPKIGLNGNYWGTEDGFLATLVHEMCHYYTYMHGKAPVQGHGPEFRAIGNAVSARSNGRFTIQRLATAEEMKEFELNDEMKARKEKRIASKKSSTTAVIRKMSDGTMQLTMTGDERIVRLIANSSEVERKVLSVITSNDANLIDLLFSKGYTKKMRTWRYWNITNSSWLESALNDSDYNILYSKDGNTTRPQVTNNVQPQKNRLFSINTNNGKFEVDANCSKDELARKIRDKFPFLSDTTIEKLMGNERNYRIVEGKKNIKNIINEVIEEFINDDDSIEITPDMNLGKFSPLELQ